MGVHNGGLFVALCPDCGVLKLEGAASCCQHVVLHHLTSCLASDSHHHLQ